MKTLDLFAGCGGFSLGLRDAGFDIVSAYEIDKWAGETYQFNHKNVNLNICDIRKISSEYWKDVYCGKIDVIAGGPPCQGFSVSGNRQYGIIGETNSLVSNFLVSVEAIRPKYVIMENVKGFKTGSISKDKKVFDYVIKTLNELGYHTDFCELNAVDYGVPSLRSRIFIVASKLGFKEKFDVRKTHSPLGSQNTKKYVSVIEAISDLPELNAGEGIEGKQNYSQSASNDYQELMRLGSCGVYNHVAMKHSKRVVERFEMLQGGESSYRFGRQVEGQIVTSYKMNNQRLHSKKPSLCITANFQSTFVHPSQPRNLSAREAARLMSFPDTFIFKGKRTQMSSKFLEKYGRKDEDFLSQYNQIGNAVPPLLAKSVGVALMNSINQ